MTTPKLERIIHKEFLPGALIEGYDRTLTYKIDENGRLKCVQFVAEGCSLNKEREIVRNPLYDNLMCSAIPLGLSAVSFNRFWVLNLGVAYGCFAHIVFGFAS